MTHIGYKHTTLARKNISKGLLSNTHTLGKTWKQSDTAKVNRVGKPGNAKNKHWKLSYKRKSAGPRTETTKEKIRKARQKQILPEKDTRIEKKLKIAHTKEKKK